MSSQPYQKYKSSGVVWLGEIPLHWQIRPVRTLFVRKTDRGHAELQLLSVYRDYGVIPTDSRDDNYNKPSLDLSGYLRIKPTDLVTNKMKTWQGSIAISEHEGIVSPAYYTCRAIHKENHRYIHYLLRSEKYVSIYLTLSKGIRVNQWDLEYENFREVPVVLPLIDEQGVIAAFLDRETARIDALIQKKQRQIELLHAKRSALISHAVTKGLDPNAKMKDSGIEWLGEIPAHWEVKRLKFVVSEPLKYGANEAAELDDSTLPRYIRITDVDADGRLRDETFKSIPEEVARPYLLREGDLLLARSGATVGKSFYYEPCWGRAAYAGYLIRARFDPAKTMPRFVTYFTNSHQYWQWLGSSFIQATIQNVSAEKYANLMVPVPPFEEQMRIVAYLDERWDKLCEILEKVEESINRLMEYRTALISAAVTGKIDVRGKYKHVI